MFKPWFRSMIAFGSLTMISFCMNVISARALGVEGRGVYAAVIAVTTLAAGLAQFGLGNAFVISYREKTALGMRRIATLSTIFVSIASIAFSTAILQLTKLAASDIQIVVATIASGTALILLSSSMLQIEDDLKSYNWIRITLPFLLLISTCILWIAGFLDAQSLLLLQAALSITTGLFSVKTLFKRLKIQSSSKAKFSSILKLGSKYHAIGVLGLASGNIDKLYLFINASLSDFGIYSVAIATSRLLGSIQESISTALFSRYAGIKDGGLFEAATLAFRLTFIPLMIIASLLSVASEHLFSVLFGEEFKSASLPFSILCFESVLGGAAWILAQYFSAKGRPGIIVIRQIIAIAPVLAFLPFISETGIAVSLAWLLLVSSMLRLLTTLWMLHRELKFNLFVLLPGKSEFLLIRRYAYKILNIS